MSSIVTTKTIITDVEEKSRVFFKEKFKRRNPMWLAFFLLGLLRFFSAIRANSPSAQTRARWRKHPQPSRRKLRFCHFGFVFWMYCWLLLFLECMLKNVYFTKMVGWTILHWIHILLKVPFDTLSPDKLSSNLPCARLQSIVDLIRSPGFFRFLYLVIIFFSGEESNMKSVDANFCP